MRSFEEIPDIAERIKRSKMELQESGFYLAPEWDSQSCCDQDYVNNFKKGWESRQTEVDELQCEVKRLNLWYSNVKLQLENKEIDSAIDAKKIDELQKQLIDQGQRFNEQSQRIKDLEHKNEELQKRVDDLELTIKGAVTFVDLQIKATEQGREAAIGTQAKNWWSSKLLMLRPIRRVLEQALKGENK